MQQCLFDYLRALENAPADAPRPELSVEGYDLTDEERAALVNNDIAAFHTRGRASRDHQRVLPRAGLQAC